MFKCAVKNGVEAYAFYREVYTFFVVNTLSEWNITGLCFIIKQKLTHLPNI